MVEKIKDKISKEHFEKYFDITSQALKAAKGSVVQSRKDDASEIFKMVECYLSDAKHFFEKSDLVNAFACVNYAHGWLDCGARLKVFDVKDSRLFTV